MFTAKDVMALRELTQAGMMDCKKALTECEAILKKPRTICARRALRQPRRKPAALQRKAS